MYERNVENVRFMLIATHCQGVSILHANISRLSTVNIKSIWLGLTGKF